MLVENDRWLAALNAAGVDNWPGYGHASDILREWEKEEENNNNKEDN